MRLRLLTAMNAAGVSRSSLTARVVKGNRPLHNSCSQLALAPWPDDRRDGCWPDASHSVPYARAAARVRDDVMFASRSPFLFSPRAPSAFFLIFSMPWGAPMPLAPASTQALTGRGASSRACSTHSLSVSSRALSKLEVPPHSAASRSQSFCESTCSLEAADIHLCTSALCSTAACTFCRDASMACRAAPCSSAAFAADDFALRLLERPRLPLSPPTGCSARLALVGEPRAGRPHLRLCSVGHVARCEEVLEGQPRGAEARPALRGPPRRAAGDDGVEAPCLGGDLEEGGDGRRGKTRRPRRGSHRRALWRVSAGHRGVPQRGDHQEQDRGRDACGQARRGEGGREGEEVNSFLSFLSLKTRFLLISRGGRVRERES